MEIPIPKPRGINTTSTRTFVNERLQCPADAKVVIHKALDAWDRISTSGKAVPADLQLVIDATLHRLAGVWYIGNDLLGNLAGRFPEAQEAVREIMRTAKAAQRWHTIQGFDSCADRAFVREILEQALNDRAASVRYRAAEKAEVLRIVELVPSITERRSIERNARVQWALDCFGALLSRGYFLDTRKQPATLWVRYGPAIRFVTLEQDAVHADQIADRAGREQREMASHPAYQWR